MPNTKVAPRRLAFPIGTKMLFGQASVPSDWTLDVSDTDRFLRVVSGAGGGVAGPDNTTLINEDLTHQHTLGSHVHNMSSHDHAYNHNHTSGISATNGMASSSVNENSANYRVRDDDGSPAGGTWNWRDDPFVPGDDHHIVVSGGANDSGDHDHDVTTVVQTVNAATQGSSQTNTSTAGGDLSNNPSTNHDHNHSIDSGFRPRFLDVVVGILVG